MMLGYQASDSETTYDIFLGVFFQSDRPTRYQETHSTVNDKKIQAALNANITSTFRL